LTRTLRSPSPIFRDYLKARLAQGLFYFTFRREDVNPAYVRFLSFGRPLYGRRNLEFVFALGDEFVRVDVFKVLDGHEAAGRFVVCPYLGYYRVREDLVVAVDHDYALDIFVLGHHFLAQCLERHLRVGLDHGSFRRGRDAARLREDPKLHFAR